MRVSTKVVFDIETGEILWRDSFEYSGPLALAQNARVTQVADEAVMSSTSPNVRVTQVVKEVAIQVHPPGRVTQVSVEAVFTVPNKGRVTQVSIEAVVRKVKGLPIMEVIE